mmetsp:Transcript_11624/g.26628  ORF Transcript_11624/g.26628 Transcript_11624/m.26628 type:complete len:202 (+) Transcript_11624:267-872(+)
MRSAPLPTSLFEFNLTVGTLLPHPPSRITTFFPNFMFVTARFSHILYLDESVSICTTINDDNTILLHDLPIGHHQTSERSVELAHRTLDISTLDRNGDGLMTHRLVSPVCPSSAPAYRALILEAPLCGCLARVSPRSSHGHVQTCLPHCPPLLSFEHVELDVFLRPLQTDTRRGGSRPSDSTGYGTATSSRLRESHRSAQS